MWRPSLKKTLKVVSIALGAPVLLVLLFTTWVLFTGPGGKLALSVVDRYDFPVSYDSFHGRLGNRFELHGVVVDQSPVYATIDRVVVDWRIGDLFSKRIRIHSVDVYGVNVIVSSGAATADTVLADSITTPDTTQTLEEAFPFDIELGRLAVDTTRVVLPDSMFVVVTSLLASGTPNSYRLSSSATVRSPLIPSAALSIVASGGLERAQLEQLDIELLDGMVSLVGVVAWLPRVEWDATLSISELRPGPLLPTSDLYPGTIHLRASTSGHLRDDGLPVATVDFDSLSGVLRAEEVRGSGSIRIDGTDVDVNDFKISWGGAMATVNAEIREEIAANVAILVPDLEALHPSAKGNVKITAEVYGPLLTPSIDAVISAGKLASDGATIDSLHLAISTRIGENEWFISDASVRGLITGITYDSVAIASVDISLDADLYPDFYNDRDIRAGIVASNIMIGKELIDRVSVDVAGVLSAHELSVRASSPTMTAEIRLRGGLNEMHGGTAWDGSIDMLTFNHSLAGRWNLEDTTSAHVSLDSAMIDGFCIAAEKGRVCVDGSWKRAGEFSGNVVIDDFPLEFLNRFIPVGQEVTGLLVAAIAVQGDADGTLLVNGDVRAGPGTLSQGRGDDRLAIVYDTTIVKLTLDSTGAAGTIRSRISLEDGRALASIDGSFSAPGFSASHVDLDNVPLTGHLSADVADIGAFTRAIPQIGDAAGKVTIEITATGTLGDPKIVGELNISECYLEIPESGLLIQQIELNVIGNNAGVVTIASSMHSHGGDLKIDGEINLSDRNKPSVAVKITGNRFAIVNTSEIAVFITPNVEASFDSSRVKIEGEVHLPYVDINLLEVPASAVGVSRDIVIVGEEREIALPLDIDASMRTVLGDSVFFRGLGLEARLSGSVLVTERTGKPTTASGHLEIHDGEYFVFGQKLKVDPGRVQFVGPADNPALDIRAYRTGTGNITAGVKVTGTVKKPMVEIYSEPSMSQASALSFLLTGRPLDESAGSDGQLLAAAALGMGLQQGNTFTQGLSGSVGLDDARVDAGDDLSQATFVAGKYLTPELYISQTMGLFDNTRIFRARYSLTRRWTLQAETGTATGSDIFFQIERGK